MVEGSEVTIESQGGSSFSPTYETIDTSKILFIGAGAFSGIENIIQRRLSKEVNRTNKSIGFGATIEYEEIDSYNIISKIQNEDFIEYGIIPELMGRLPVTCTLDELTEKDLVMIMKDTKNSALAQYKELFKKDGIELEFTDELIQSVASEAIKKGTGARAIKSILENKLLDQMFSSPGQCISKIIVDKDSIKVKKKTVKIKDEIEGEI